MVLDPPDHQPYQAPIEDRRGSAGREPPSVHGEADLRASPEGRIAPTVGVCHRLSNLSSCFWDPVSDRTLGLAGSLLQRELSAAVRRSPLLAVLTFPLAWVVAFALSNLVVVPLRHIAQGVNRMARGDFNTVFASDRDDEVGQIAAKLNLLGRQIQPGSPGFF